MENDFDNIFLQYNFHFDFKCENNVQLINSKKKKNVEMKKMTPKKKVEKKYE